MLKRVDFHALGDGIVGLNNFGNTCFLYVCVRRRVVTMFASMIGRLTRVCARARVQQRHAAVPVDDALAARHVLAQHVSLRGTADARRARLLSRLLERPERGRHAGPRARRDCQARAAVQGAASAGRARALARAGRRTLRRGAATRHATQEHSQSDREQDG